MSGFEHTYKLIYYSPINSDRDGVFLWGEREKIDDFILQQRDKEHSLIIFIQFFDVKDVVRHAIAVAKKAMSQDKEVYKYSSAYIEDYIEKQNTCNELFFKWGK